jgi:hypothetical protein
MSSPSPSTVQAMTPQVLAALAGGAAAGALITALTTLLAAWLTRRHEHRKWLLDKRMETAVAFNKAAQVWIFDFTKPDHQRTLVMKSGDDRSRAEAVQYDEIVRNLTTAGQAAGLVWPYDVYKLIQDALQVPLDLATRVDNAKQEGLPVDHEWTIKAATDFGTAIGLIYEAQMTELQDLPRRPPWWKQLAA